jgi:hypothetical protein
VRAASGPNPAVNMDAPVTLMAHQYTKPSFGDSMGGDDGHDHHH